MPMRISDWGMHTFNTFNSLLGGIVESRHASIVPGIYHNEIQEMVEYAKTIQMKLFDETRKQIFDIRTTIYGSS